MVYKFLMNFLNKLISLSLSLFVVCYIFMPMIAFSETTTSESRLGATFVKGNYSTITADYYTLTFPSNIDIPEDGNGDFKISISPNFSSENDSLTATVCGYNTENGNRTEEYFELKNTENTNISFKVNLQNYTYRWHYGDKNQLIVNYSFADANVVQDLPDGVYTGTLLIEATYEKVN